MGLVASTAEEVEVGDRVLAESEKVGSATRSRVVTDVDGRLITVRWYSGSSSTFVPSAGCLQVTGHEPQAEQYPSLGDWTQIKPSGSTMAHGLLRSKFTDWPRTYG
jgi:hypothetical protein